MYGIIEKYQDRVDHELLAPTVRWREALDAKPL
jgi:hypothetical protein